MKYGKMIVLLILALSLLFPAMAENVTKVDDSFSIRNNITYGMNYNQVLYSEFQQNGMEPTSSEDNIDTSQDYGYPFDYTKSIGYRGITISNIPDSFLSYYFDENDILVSIGYRFGSAYIVPPIDATYSSMKNALTKKYGKPYNDTGTLITKELITSELSNNYRNNVLFSLIDSRTHISNICQWCISYQNCDLLIDLFTCQSSRNEFCYIGYKLFPVGTFNNFSDDMSNNDL